MWTVHIPGKKTWLFPCTPSSNYFCTGDTLCALWGTSVTCTVRYKRYVHCEVQALRALWGTSVTCTVRYKRYVHCEVQTLCALWGTNKFYILYSAIRFLKHINTILLPYTLPSYCRHIWTIPAGQLQVLNVLNKHVEETYFLVLIQHAETYKFKVLLCMVGVC